MSCDIKSLDPKKFLDVMKKREIMIENASDVMSKKERPINSLYKSLHPEIQHLRVKNVIERSNDTKSYILESDDENKLAYFIPGQYISVNVEIDGYTHNRPYSLVSSPKESKDGIYEICVKKTHDGLVSKHIYDTWNIGTRVNVSDPQGNFYYSRLRDKNHIIAVAGGSGITPFISMIRSIDMGILDMKITLIYGSRRYKDILFKDELLSYKNENISVVFVLSDEAHEGCEFGNISSDIIKKYSGNSEYSLFVCGPLGLHSYIKEESKKLDLENKDIRYELFGEAKKAECGKKVTIKVISNGKEHMLNGNTSETILRSIEKADIKKKAICRSGECGYCRSRLIDGEVEIKNESDRRRLADEAHGYIHPCCTYPTSDITVEI